MVDDEVRASGRPRGRVRPGPASFWLALRAAPRAANGRRPSRPGGAGTRSARSDSSGRRRPTSGGLPVGPGRAGGDTASARPRQSAASTVEAAAPVTVFILLVERAGVDDRLGVAVAAQNDEQVRYHGRLSLLVEIDDLLPAEFLESHLHHA